ncbi:MAG: hypothetical protein C5B49_04875 [Bdellovibrio sp.]|nr:MAG: hypothetical protein C5B49_04875 [Bdellovibrio sp.]
MNISKFWGKEARASMSQRRCTYPYDVDGKLPMRSFIRFLAFIGMSGFVGSFLPDESAWALPAYEEFSNLTTSDIKSILKQPNGFVFVHFTDSDAMTLRQKSAVVHQLMTQGIEVDRYLGDVKNESMPLRMALRLNSIAQLNYLEGLDFLNASIALERAGRDHRFSGPYEALRAFIRNGFIGFDAVEDLVAWQTNGMPHPLRLKLLPNSDNVRLCFGLEVVPREARLVEVHTLRELQWTLERAVQGDQKVVGVNARTLPKISELLSRNHFGYLTHYTRSRLFPGAVEKNALLPSAQIDQHKYPIRRSNGSTEMFTDVFLGVSGQIEHTPISYDEYDMMLFFDNRVADVLKRFHLSPGLLWGEKHDASANTYEMVRYLLESNQGVHSTLELVTPEEVSLQYLREIAVKPGTKDAIIAYFRSVGLADFLGIPWNQIIVEREVFPSQSQIGMGRFFAPTQPVSCQQVMAL